MAASAVMIDSPGRLIGFLERFTGVLGATLVVLYVYNARENLPRRRMLAMMSVFMVWLAIGGYLSSGVAQIQRYARWATPIERQQVKWYIGGVACAMLGVVAFQLPAIWTARSRPWKKRAPCSRFRAGHEGQCMKDATLGLYDTTDLRAAAQRRLPKGLFEFMDRGNDDEIAMRDNRAALESIKLVSRVLVDVSKRSQEITLFGKPQSAEGPQREAAGWLTTPIVAAA